MKSFDAFGRPVQEFQVKTTFGGYLSLCSLLCITTLFLTELRYFMQLEVRDEMVIDQNQDQKSLNISINVTLPGAPCSVLSMNLLDPKRANIMHVGTEIYKTRLSKEGSPLGRPIRDSLVNVAQSSTELSAAGGTSSGVRTSHATTHLRCQSCFGAHEDEDDCCASCDDVREEFRKRGWDDKPKGYTFGQCASESYEEVAAQEGEGCRIDALLHVRKVPATFHLGVPTHFKPEKLKDPEDWSNFVSSLDFSHDIRGLSFGPDFPGLVPVLDGRKKDKHTAPNSEHYQYDIHVIPTRYLEDGYDEISSHQYSVIEYMKSLSQQDPNQDVVAPGLWMSYDFTPFEVRVTKTRKSMWHFLTECCAILGGIFAFTGMIDNFAYSLNKAAGSRGRGGGGTQLTSM